MGKASSNKKVDRAARAGGKVRSAQRRSLVFPSVIGVVVLLGMVLIVVSAGENRSDASVEPKLGTHWHAAFGVYHCDEFLAPLSDDPSHEGLHHIHTHADGLIHIHPTSSTATGYDATLEVLFDTTGAEVSADRIEVAGTDPLEAGGKCGDEDAEIRLAVWDVKDRNASGQPVAWDETPTIVEGDPSNYRPQDDQLITLAYVPSSLPDEDIPQPPSVSSLAAPVDEQAPGSEVPLTIPEDVTDTTVAGTETTTEPATETTEAGAETDTTDADTTDTTEPTG